MPSRAQIQNYRRRLAQVVALKVAKREREAKEAAESAGRFTVKQGPEQDQSEGGPQDDRS